MASGAAAGHEPQVHGFREAASENMNTPQAAPFTLSHSDPPFGLESVIAGLLSVDQAASNIAGTS